ncbi:MAG TPA: glycosyltransferase family 4 protein [Dokdonella sp.]|uniref:glycosyltransferase family 4 protein n=1 Tax=Dokdonella sp. TaxID=2291710 RepID=UPI002D7ED542|nr:glycosyltransferase family 4 protein [Dokdonella sp.]HET9034255.1 glycosyltransferase family 4 protein [Dokdonella sp.]
MKVLFISTSYPRDVSDWRGIFMHHLVAALVRAPSIRLNVWAPPGELPDRAKSVLSRDDAEWLAALMAAGGISHLMRSGGWRTWLEPLRLLRKIGGAYRANPDQDIYHINWLQCALPLPRNRKPALITVLGNDLKLLKLPFMRVMLRRVMKKRRVAICPNADWMRPALEAAFGDIAEICPVPFGINPDWYAIRREPVVAKPHRWLVVTRLTANKLGPLFDWSEKFFADGDRELHLFGPMQEGVQVPDWVHYHGPATPEQLLSEWFPGACGLITLSRHAEGRPQVMLEAMASSLPIIASRMPAHAEIVFDGETGLLCDDTDSYVKALLVLEDKLINQRMGEAARRWATREIGTWDDCANRYVQIYQRLLGSS